MSGTQEQILPRRKRRRSEVTASEHPSKLHPSERYNSRIQFHSAGFYDRLSTLWLTRRALKEHRRRTSKAQNIQLPSSIPQHLGKDSWGQIKRFARHGGPDLHDIRGYATLPTATEATCMSAMDSGSSISNDKPTVSTKLMKRLRDIEKSSAYDRNFEQLLIDHSIYPEGCDYLYDRAALEPGNFEEIYQRLEQRRPSLSLSCLTTSDFQSFKQANNRAISEKKVMSTVLPVMHGNTNTFNEGDLVFTRLQSITNGTTVHAKPDFFDGAHLGELDRRVREDLGQFIVPTGHAIAPVVPNFFFEIKPHSGDLDVAKRQVCYDGALGARAMHELQLYKRKRVYDNKAYTLTSTYQGGQLLIYAHYPMAGPESSTEYHMTLINGWSMIGNLHSFQQGVTAFRNARDWAREQRDAFISTANEKARCMPRYQPQSELSDHQKIG
ncbi:hypothetical protein F5884DRAFT_101721 [Xylogone sp. PMI_703]|nr:hypothetical protein F5884DRAFT_101721 [Xylogone sp. PMI_703]